MRKQTKQSAGKSQISVFFLRLFQSLHTFLASLPPHIILSAIALVDGACVVILSAKLLRHAEISLLIGFATHIDNGF